MHVTTIGTVPFLRQITQAKIAECEQKRRERRDLMVEGAPSNDRLNRANIQNLPKNSGNIDQDEQLDTEDAVSR